ncbi:MAG: metal-dependent transcriptional regulator, partial [Flavobacterium sp.]|nr:metal-dependent transcriptional regulator [Candidatus Neoflavobacterium equi]
QVSPQGISTNAIAEMMHSKPSSVTDMIKKLAEKKWVNYMRYQGVTLTPSGLNAALMIIRRHRLWELFLVQHLEFSWDEVHELAEKLEHIKSEKLIDRLEEKMQFPAFDPHGDPIPDRKGKMSSQSKLLLSDGVLGQQYICVGVLDSSSLFLQFLDKYKITLGSEIKIVEREDFDASLTIELNGSQISISNKIAANLFVK